MNKVAEQGIDIGAILGDFLGEHVDRIAADVITGDEVDFHEGAKISIPRGMTYSKAKKILDRLEEESETPTAFTRIFKYRPDDGGHAAFQVIKSLYGMSMGKKTETFFGTLPAEKRTISIGVGKTLQIPWGRIEIPVLPGLELFLGETKNRDYGAVFGIQGTGPKKYQERMEELFNAIEKYLQEHSIYRGNAIIGSEYPEFLDLSSFRADQIVFSDEVTATLEGTLWTPIRHTESLVREGIPLKRAVLAYGPYGTGKTSAGLLTALEAVTHGWTFISAQVGRDKPEDVLRTARLYEPAVVFVEDIDHSTSSGENEDVAKFLDAFDGISSKKGKVIALMTSNHIETIHKGMLRPGRLDAVVEIAELDRNGIERLVKVTVDSRKLDEPIDYDAVYESMSGFLPAFAKEAINRSVLFSIGRLNGSTEYTIGTEDLVAAAHSLRAQLELQEGANEGKKRPSLDMALGEAVRGAVKELAFYDPDSDDFYAPRDATQDELKRASF